MERKSEWSSWTVADVAAGMSGFRAETKGQLSAPSANHPDGTRQNSRKIDPVERCSTTPVVPQNLIQANGDANSRSHGMRRRS